MPTRASAPAQLDLLPASGGVSPDPAPGHAQPGGSVLVKEALRLEDSDLVRSLVIRGQAIESRVAVEKVAVSVPPHGSPRGTVRLRDLWSQCYLRGASPGIREAGAPRRLRVVDLFCGAGGFALGLRQLSAELGWSVVTELAADIDSGATAVFAANHRTNVSCTRSVASLVDFRLRGTDDAARFVYPPEIPDRIAARAVANVDLVTAGPPCQGHSNLNNRSRRDDPRNRLFLTVPAFAVASGAGAVVIENVPSVVHDRSAVTGSARALFEDAGYGVDEAVLAADGLGWPQTRRRYFMVARRQGRPFPLAALAADLAAPAPSVWWAIGDLEDHDSREGDPMHQHSELSQENLSRIESLFANDSFDLPLEERPVCHQNGTTYISVYGRMHRDRPAPTITTGFMSPGRGRFVHPTRPRTLTPREAARLQGFPDSYRFVPDPANPPTRHQLAKWIGDAVPMPLGYVAALSALGPDLLQ